MSSTLSRPGPGTPRTNPGFPFGVQETGKQTDRNRSENGKSGYEGPRSWEVGPDTPSPCPRCPTPCPNLRRVHEDGHDSFCVSPCSPEGVWTFGVEGPEDSSSDPHLRRFISFGILVSFSPETRVGETSTTTTDHYMVLRNLPVPDPQGPRLRIGTETATGRQGKRDPEPNEHTLLSCPRTLIRGFSGVKTLRSQICPLSTTPSPDKD